MFASHPPARERFSREWRSAAALRKTDRQLSGASSSAIQTLLTLFPSDVCRLFARSFTLLALFFDVVLFVFSNLQTLFAKHGGYGVPPS